MATRMDFRPRTGRGTHRGLEDGFDPKNPFFPSSSTNLAILVSDTVYLWGSTRTDCLGISSLPSPLFRDPSLRSSFKVRTRNFNLTKRKSARGVHSLRQIFYTPSRLLGKPRKYPTHPKGYCNTIRTQACQSKLIVINTRLMWVNDNTGSGTITKSS